MNVFIFPKANWCNVWFAIFRGDHVQGHVEVEVSEDETEASATLPGFAYNDFNRAGEESVKFYSLLKSIKPKCIKNTDWMCVNSDDFLGGIRHFDVEFKCGC